jgi:hypothetical protein
MEVKMFNLDTKQEERARRLLHEAVVIDSLGGYDEPTEEFKQLTDQLLASGMSFNALMEQLNEFEVQHPSEFGQAWKEGFKTSGMNALSLTMGPFGKELFSLRGRGGGSGAVELQIRCHPRVDQDHQSR